MSRLNQKSFFVSFVSCQYHVIFYFIDDYLIWLYEIFCHFDENLYYQTLEEDIVKYFMFQERK